MRDLDYTGQLKRDYKREKKGRYRTNLDTALATALAVLANDGTLDSRYYDHALSGRWKDHRDCHIKPDLVLIYQKPTPDILRLVRLGSHAELGL